MDSISGELVRRSDYAKEELIRSELPTGNSLRIGNRGLHPTVEAPPNSMTGLYGRRVAGGARHVEPNVDVSIVRLASGWPASAFRRSLREKASMTTAR